MYNEKISFISPDLPMRFFKRHIDSAALESPMHFHPVPELLYVTGGTLKCITADAEYIAHRGDVIFLNKSTPHQTISTEHNTCYSLLQFRAPDMTNVDSGYLHQFLKRDEISACILPSGEADTVELIGYMNNIFRENKTQTSAYHYYLTANIYLITALLHRCSLMSDAELSTNGAGLKKIMPAIEYIESNYQESITLDTLCRITNLTRYYFCHIFKSLTGGTAIDYLNFVRICKACELLKNDIPVTSIGYNVGFSSPSYFNSVFNKYKSCSPKDYRKMWHYGK